MGRRPISINYSPLLYQYKEAAQGAASSSGADFSKEQNIKKLEEKEKKIKDKHGFLYIKGKDNTKILLAGNINKFSPAKFTIASLRMDVVELYKNGEISYENADKMLTRRGKFNDSTVNVISSIGTGFLAATAGLALKGKCKSSMTAIVGLTSLVGAVTNAGIRMLDRAFNNIKGDEFNPITMAKDALSGALNGMLSGFNIGIDGKNKGDSILTGKYIGKKIGFEALKQAGFIAAEKLFNYKENED